MAPVEMKLFTLLASLLLDKRSSDFNDSSTCKYVYAVYST